MPKQRKKYIAEQVDERFYSIKNNIENDYTHVSINNQFKSGVLTKSKGKIAKESSSEMGTLPASIITTGRLLQDFTDPFDDTNILVFKDNQANVNSIVGVPLVDIVEEIDGVETKTGFYLTTDERLISAGKIDKNSKFFRPMFSLTNTNIFDEPNSLDSREHHMQTQRSVKSKVVDLLLRQNYFQEKNETFNEGFLSTQQDGQKNSEFYTTSVDKGIKDNYDLGEQKQIKIELDFTNPNDSTINDLILMNTKLTFNLPYSSQQNDDLEASKNNFSDLLIPTQYINFLESEVKTSYSSHFLPTAYWNFNKQRWNYLDGVTLKYDEKNLSTPLLDDFPVDNLDEIKYSYLGAKNVKGKSLSISPNFIFDAEGNLSSLDIQNKHLENSFLSVYNKPIMTTPAFRNDGSFNLSNNDSSVYNKSSISNITNTYGFPYKPNWQPDDSHLLDMSKYINNNFLLEKVIVKGKFSSNGEMPTKKGNFDSGYLESNGSHLSSNDFSENYEMKDSHHDYVANNISFFILNERKGFNYIEHDTLAEPLQSYFFTKEIAASDVQNKSKHTQGKNLKNYLGKYTSYENNISTLNVYSQIVPNSYLYELDTYNNIRIDDVYNITSNTNNVKVNMYENIFHYLDSNTTNALENTVDSIYSKNGDPVGTNLLSNDNKTYNINLESSTEIKVQTAGNFKSGKIYKIKSLSEGDNGASTDFTLIGAQNNSIGTLFTASGAGSNSGTAYELDLTKFKNDRHQTVSAGDFKIGKVYKIKSLNDGASGENTDFTLIGSQENSVGTFFLATGVGSNSGSAYEIDLYSNFFNVNSGRELVSYSNFLIASKYSDIDFDKTLFKNIDIDNSYIKDIDRSSAVYDLNLNIETPQDFKIESFVHTTNSSSDYTDESIYKVKSNYFEKSIESEEELSSLTLSLDKTYLSAIENIPYDDPSNGILFSYTTPGDDGDDFGGIFGSDINSLVSQGYVENFKIPFKIKDDQISPETCFSYLEFSIDDDASKEAGIIINFSYKNPKDSLGDNIYTDRHSLSPDVQLYLTHFIEYSTLVKNSSSYNVIDLNLRFIDPWHDFGIYNQWFDYGRVDTYQSHNVYELNTDLSNVALLPEWQDVFANQRTKFEDTISANIVKFVLYGLYHAEIVTKSGTVTNKKFYEFLDSYNFSIDNNSLATADFKFKETVLNPYTNSASKHINFNQGSDIASSSITNLLSLYSKKRGNKQVDAIESYYNTNYILEGKTPGEPNNIGVVSERLIDDVFVNKNKIKPIKSKSGKLLNHKTYDGINRQTYMLKPEDRLVFGISSYCNGEVMPTVVKLHDKLEITLIGRDYIDSKKVKTNEARSIRKTIIGDNYFDNTGSNIYQTKNTYYDNVWNKKSLINSLSDFSESKNVIGKNSSRKFGTYTGIVTFDRVFNGDKTIYKKDSINPSIATIFLDVYNFSPVYSQDALDVYHSDSLTRKLNKLIKTTSSYKILLSEIISDDNLNEYPNRYQNVIKDWHKTFHLEKYKSFFSNDNNIKINENSFSKLLGKYSTENENNNYFSIYYDTNSYSIGGNYDGSSEVSLLKSQNSNNDITISSNNNISKYYKTLKTYILPFSKSDCYQNSLNISNNLSQTYNGLNNFLYSDIDINLNVEKMTELGIMIANYYSIQYLNHNIKPNYTNHSRDVEKETNDRSSWCLVIEMSDFETDKVIDKLSSTNKATFNSKYVKKTYEDPEDNSASIEVTYYDNELNISLHQYVSNIIENPLLTKDFAMKNCKLIKRIHSNESTKLTNFLVIPLYFWETLELDAKEDENLIEHSTTKYARKTNLYNVSNNIENIDAMWYAKLSDDSLIYDNIGIYNNFIDDTHNLARPPSVNSQLNVSGLYSGIDITKALPYTKDQIEAINTSEWLNSNNTPLLLIKNKIMIANSVNKLINQDFKKEKDSSYLEKSDRTNDLDNFYLLKNQSTFFTRNCFLDNNIELISKKNALGLSMHNDLDVFLNENIYYSKCKKVKENIEFDTTTNLVYKVIKNNSSLKVDGTQESYKTIELLGVDNDFTLFAKNKILEDTLIYSFDNTNTVKVFEDNLKRYKTFSYDNTDAAIPSFEINLGSNLSDSLESNGAQIYQIPYTHYSIDYIPPSSSADNIDISNDSFINTGSPIYKLTKQHLGYSSISEQENKTRDFFYGFSRGNRRYPIERLDGFKYGVESGSLKSYKVHYNNKKYGNFSDKIMGTSNYALSYLDSSGVLVTNYTISKSFVDPYFQQISNDNVILTYNNDVYCRSDYPYIEDATNSLSQLNSNHSLYNENIEF